MLVFALLLVIAIVFGVLGSWIAAEKNRDGSEGFLLGCLFGPLGAIIEAMLPTVPKENVQAARKSQAEQDAEIQARMERATDRDREKWARIEAEYQAKKRERARVRSERYAAALAEKETRRNARDEALRARGIERGPWAWFQALPDVVQALLLGLAIAVPAAVLLVVVIRAWR